MDYSIKNILVPIDFSETADNALRLAVSIAKSQGATLHILHIVSTHALPSSPSDNGDIGNELALIIASSMKRIDDYQYNIADHSEIKVKGVVEPGAIYENICTYAVNKKIDLVVIGTHGISGWREFVIGSTAMSVIKQCPCPVLTVAQTYRKSSFSSVLYPVRNVAGVAEKYDYIKSIVDKNKSEIHLLGVVEEMELTDQELINNMKKVIDSILNDRDIITYETHFCKNVADKILEKARVRHDDLIVINATLDTDWKDRFSGSYTQRIVNHADIPVLSIKF